MRLHLTAILLALVATAAACTGPSFADGRAAGCADARWEGELSALDGRGPDALPSDFGGTAWDAGYGDGYQTCFAEGYTAGSQGGTQPGA
jgi:hypothetical protein